MFNLASAVANGTVHDDVRDCLTDLRALCVFKPDGTHRPLSMPEAETRIFLGAVATQEKPALHAWYTSPLPEDVAAKDLRIAAARASVEIATAKLRSASAAANAEGSARASATIATAQATIEAEQLPVNIPTNTAFSPHGCQKLSHTIDTWMQALPD